MGKKMGSAGNDFSNRALNLDGDAEVGGKTEPDHFFRISSSEKRPPSKVVARIRIFLKVSW